MACIARQVSVFTGVLLLFSAVLLVSFPAMSFAGEKVSEDVRFSLDFQNERLGSVCEKIARATGYEIEIDSTWEEVSVSGSLKSVSVHEGLMKILHNYNAIIHVADGAKKCKVVILESSGRIADIPPISKDKVLSAKKKVYSPAEEVVPPSKEGGRGITVRELKAIIARQSGKEDRDMEVAPSTEPGKKGITKRELEAIMARHSGKGNGDLEVISPPEPGKKGITKKELETRTKMYSSTGPETIAPVPPFLHKGIGGMGDIGEVR